VGLAFLGGGPLLFFRCRKKKLEGGGGAGFFLGARFFSGKNFRKKLGSGRFCEGGTPPRDYGFMLSFLHPGWKDFFRCFPGVWETGWTDFFFCRNRLRLPGKGRDSGAGGAPKTLKNRFFSRSGDFFEGLECFVLGGKGGHRATQPRGGDRGGPFFSPRKRALAWGLASQGVPGRNPSAGEDLFLFTPFMIPVPRPGAICSRGMNFNGWGGGKKRKHWGFGRKKKLSKRVRGFLLTFYTPRVGGGGWGDFSGVFQVRFKKNLQKPTPKNPSKQGGAGRGGGAPRALFFNPPPPPPTPPPRHQTPPPLPPPPKKPRRGRGGLFTRGALCGPFLWGGGGGGPKAGGGAHRGWACPFPKEPFRFSTWRPSCSPPRVFSQSPPRINQKKKTAFFFPTAGLGFLTREGGAECRRG